MAEMSATEPTAIAATPRAAAELETCADDVCSICLTAVPERTTACNHGFCDHCLTQYARSSRATPLTCPMCRRPLGDDDLPAAARAALQERPPPPAPPAAAPAPVPPGYLRFTGRNEDVAVQHSFFWKSLCCCCLTWGQLWEASHRGRRRPSFLRCAKVAIVLWLLVAIALGCELLIEVLDHVDVVVWGEQLRVNTASHAMDMLRGDFQQQLNADAGYRLGFALRCGSWWATIAAWVLALYMRRRIRRTRLLQGFDDPTTNGVCCCCCWAQHAVLWLGYARADSDYRILLPLGGARGRGVAPAVEGTEATQVATPQSPTAGAARQAVMAARAAAQAAARSAAVSPWGPGRRTQSGTPGGGWLAPPAGTPAAAGPQVTV